jgi:hypothetical protein
MASLPDIGIAQKIESSEYQPYASGSIFSAPSGFAETRGLEQICLFPDGHYL